MTDLQTTSHESMDRWHIERQGEVIALLSDPRPEQMFWTSYRMELLTSDPTLQDRMHTQAFWAAAEIEGLVWRHEDSGALAPGAFPALEPFPEPGRLLMRNLALARAPLSLWERLAQRVRRALRPMS